MVAPARRVPSVRELLGVRDRPVEEPTAADAVAALRAVDPVWHIEETFYIPSGGRLQMPPHQKVTTRVLLQRNPAGRYQYTTIMYSTVKKSGKSTWGGAVARWFAETQARMSEVYCVGNDLKQARERAFRELRRSLELTPGFVPGRDVLPGRWNCLANSMRCLTTGTVVQALAVDARGEAGGAPALSVWTELWAFEYAAALAFWNELTTVPTIPDSIRLVETYAGFVGESKLLLSLYERGRSGRQLTNHEAATIAARDVDGERYPELLRAWHDCWPDGCGGAGDSGLCRGDPDALVPLWVDERGLAMYWDSGVEARRMPWLRGDAGRLYYAQQEFVNLPHVYEQHHLNQWTANESSYIPTTIWDGLYDPNMPPLMPGDPTPIVVSVDAASTGDCFGVLAASRHWDPELAPTHAAIRACRKWDPPRGGRIDYTDPEGFIRFLCQGGCQLGHPTYPPFRRTTADCGEGGPAAGKAACTACDALARGEVPRTPGFNVLQIAYDPYQLEDMMQRFKRESMTNDPDAVKVWCEEFPQKEARARADRRLYDMAINQRLVHNGDPALREHIGNAAAQTQKLEDSRLRVVKKREDGGKIDLVVCASMAVDRIMEKIIA